VDGDEILRPLALIIPSVTTTVRDTMVSEVGTLIFDSTQSKLCFCKTKAAGATSWELITSVEEGGA